MKLIIAIGDVEMSVKEMLTALELYNTAAKLDTRILLK